MRESGSRSPGTRPSTSAPGGCWMGRSAAPKRWSSRRAPAATSADRSSSPTRSELELGYSSVWPAIPATRRGWAGMTSLMGEFSVVDCWQFLEKRWDGSRPGRRQGDDQSGPEPGQRLLRRLLRSLDSRLHEAGLKTVGHRPARNLDDQPRGHHLPEPGRRRHNRPRHAQRNHRWRR